MASEARRGAKRIATNYTRLGLTVSLGLVLVPILIHGVGRDGYGLYALLGSTIGFAQMFRDIARQSMNRELGAAYHSGDPARFAAIFNAACVISLGLACLAVLVFVILFLAVPHLNIPPNLEGEARWVIVSGGVNTFFVIGLEAMQNMYVVTERFAYYNGRTTLERAQYTIVAFILFIYPFHFQDALGLKIFAVSTNAVSLMILFSMNAQIRKLEPMVRPDFSKVTREALRSVGGTGTWNVLTVTAMNLHIRVDQLIVNHYFGTSGNAAFALAVTLTSYIRMLTVGVTDGLDAVSARLSAGEKKDDAIRSLVRHTTRMTAFVALPAGIVVFALARPLMELWVAHRASKAVVLVPLAVGAVQILMVGMTSRAITDNWTRILYGAGFVSRYARQILLGGLLNPLVAIVLVKFVLPGPFPPSSIRTVYGPGIAFTGVFTAVPEPYKFYGPAIAFSAVFTAVHLFFLPSIGARCLKVRYRDLLGPIIPSALVALICSPIVLLSAAWVSNWTLIKLGLVGGFYGGAYFLISMFAVVTREEHVRIWRFAQRTLGRRRPPPGPSAPAKSTDPIAGAAEEVE